MDITYNASDPATRDRIQADLTSKGYKVTTNGSARLAYPYPVRVWRVEEVNEQKVIDLIVAVDPGAVPVVPAPAYTHT